MESTTGKDPVLTVDGLLTSLAQMLSEIARRHVYVMSACGGLKPNARGQPVRMRADEFRTLVELVFGDAAKCKDDCAGCTVDVLARSEPGDPYKMQVQRCRACGLVKMVVREFDPLDPTRVIVLRPGDSKDGFSFPAGDVVRWPDGPDVGCC